MLLNIHHAQRQMSAYCMHVVFPSAAGWSSRNRGPPALRAQPVAERQNNEVCKQGICDITFISWGGQLLG